MSTARIARRANAIECTSSALQAAKWAAALSEDRLELEERLRSRLRYRAKGCKTGLEAMPRGSSNGLRTAWHPRCPSQEVADITAWTDHARSWAWSPS